MTIEPRYGGHYRIVCPGCGDVVSQCRCSVPDKPTHTATGLCPTCAAKQRQQRVAEGATAS